MERRIVAYYGGDAARDRAESRARELTAAGAVVSAMRLDHFEYLCGEILEDPLLEHGINTIHVVVEY